MLYVWTTKRVRVRTKLRLDLEICDSSCSTDRRRDLAPDGAQDVKNIKPPETERARFTRGASALLRSTRAGGELVDELSCAQVVARSVWEFPRSSTILLFRCDRSFPLENSLQMCYVNWNEIRELQSDYVMKDVFWPGFLVPEPAAAESDEQIETWLKRRQTRHHTRVPDRSDGAANVDWTRRSTRRRERVLWHPVVHCVSKIQEFAQRKKVTTRWITSVLDFIACSCWFLSCLLLVASMLSAFFTKATSWSPCRKRRCVASARCTFDQFRD